MQFKLPTSVLLCVVLSACGGAAEDTGQERPFTRIQEPWAYTSLSEEYVIQSTTDWATTWHRHEPRWLPAHDPLMIDFGSSMVVGLTRGYGSSLCDTLTITRVQETSQRLIIGYARGSSAPGQPCAASLSALTDFVVIARSAKPVEFVLGDT